ncbi:LAFE_0B10506g1_1 [Lachancea fermentati]|uniref:LAFE_0B10506g1_1 n=1 Tax=Lachancea fermentati TaxID=4955 RepID=A0A1G4M8P0_LACFM|nr:LAFE_0B10506g1_1 [Lachancea fermentati]
MTDLGSQISHVEYTSDRFAGPRLPERDFSSFSEEPSRHGIGTKNSTKQERSLFTHRTQQYRSLKDSLLLYDSSVGEDKKQNAIQVQRRHLSGAKPGYIKQGSLNKDARDPVENFKFEKGKHAWYESVVSKEKPLRLETQQDSDQSITTNSLKIKNVIERATETIAKSQHACQNIKDRLEKYNLSKDITLPGAFVGPTAEIDISASESIGQQDKRPESSPINLATNCLMVPIILKGFYFFLFHTANSESGQYSFGKSCSAIIGVGVPSFTILQLDNIILQSAEVWMVVRLLPFLAKFPWHIHQLISDYEECCKVGRDVLYLKYSKEYKELRLVCENHVHQSEVWRKLSIMSLMVFPCITLFGFLLLHHATFTLATSVISYDPKFPAYSSLMLVIFSASQFVMLNWCLLIQFCKDAFDEIEVYVKDQSEKFIEDTQFITEQIHIAQGAMTKATEKKTTGASCTEDYQFSEAAKISESDCPAPKTPQCAYLKSYTPYSYESPLKGKEGSHIPTSIIRPVSPSKPLPSPTTPAKSRGQSFVVKAIGVPFKIFNLYYQSFWFLLKLSFFFVLISISYFLSIMRARSWV